MLKKSIKFTDFNGTERVVDEYFYLSKVELTEMSVDNNLQTMIKDIVKADDQKELFKQFQEIVLKAHGVKSDDGLRFVKNDETRENFRSSAAFEALVMELVTDDTAAVDFMVGLLPPDMAQNEQLRAAVASGTSNAEILERAVESATKPTNVFDPPTPSV